MIKEIWNKYTKAVLLKQKFTTWYEVATPIQCECCAPIKGGVMRRHWNMVYHETSYGVITFT